MSIKYWLDLGTYNYYKLLFITCFEKKNSIDIRITKFIFTCPHWLQEKDEKFINT